MAFSSNCKKYRLIYIIISVLISSISFSQNHYWKPVGFNRVDDQISCYTQYNGELYIAHGNVLADISFVSKLTNNTWVNVCSVNLSIKYIKVIKFYKSTLYLGGSFYSYESDQKKGMIMKYENNQWKELGAIHEHNFVGPAYVSSMEIYQGKLALGGYFDAMGPFQNANSIAFWDGTNFSTIGEGLQYIDSVITLPGIVTTLCANAVVAYPMLSILGDFVKADTNWVRYSTRIFGNDYAPDPAMYKENQVYKPLKYKFEFVGNCTNGIDTLQIEQHWTWINMSNNIHQLYAYSIKENYRYSIIEGVSPFSPKSITYINNKIYIYGNFRIPNEEHFFEFNFTNLKKDSFNNQNLELIPHERSLDTIQYLLSQDNKLIAIGNFHDKNGLNLYNIAWYDSTGSQFVGLNENKKSDLAFTLYPNPATEKLKIKSCQMTANSLVRIYSVSGVLVWKGILRNAEEEIDVSSLPRGIYFLSCDEQYSKFTVIK